jgi:hypothetical protein
MLLVGVAFWSIAAFVGRMAGFIGGFAAMGFLCAALGAMCLSAPHVLQK